MKKFLLSLVLFISIPLSQQCLANQASLTENHSELTNATMISTINNVEEIEVVLWEEISIYTLIVGIYSTWWLKRKI